MATAIIPIAKSVRLWRVPLMRVVREPITRFSISSVLLCFLPPTVTQLVAGSFAVVALSWIVEPIVAFIAFVTSFFIASVNVPRIRILSFLGAISYSLYFLHVPIGGRVINIGRRFADGSTQELFVSLAALAVALLVATIFSKYVEGPAKRASKRIALRPPYSRLAPQSTPG